MCIILLSILNNAVSGNIILTNFTPKKTDIQKVKIIYPRS